MRWDTTMLRWGSVHHRGPVCCFWGSRRGVSSFWVSLCRFRVLIVFHIVPNMFSVCFYQVLDDYLWCSQYIPHIFPNSITLYPISFAQSSTLVTNINRSKKKNRVYSIFGSVLSENFVYMMGQWKWCNWEHVKGTHWELDLGDGRNRFTFHLYTRYHGGKKN